MSKPRILVVDDEPNNLQVLRMILNESYQLSFARNGEEALERVANLTPQLILLDIMMPGMDGYEVCRRLKSNPETQHIPVIFVSAMGEVEDETEGFAAGCVDYITKPVRRAIVLARVKTHLSLVGMDQLVETQLELIHRLGCAAEYKDNETGLHVIRMGHFSRVLGEAMGMDDEQADLLFHAAPMHDIGKIGIPDHILRKPGPLDETEWQTMQQHPEFGAKILGEYQSPLLDMSRSIAISHHEKWDGSGYPHQLAGEQIPLEGRIVAIADVFDALTSQRPYKEAWSNDEAMRLINESAGKHFDPSLVEAFNRELPSIVKIQQQWQEQ